MQGYSFLNLLASATVVAPDTLSDDSDLNILYEMRALCAPKAQTPEEILLSINKQSNQAQTDSLIGSQSSWLMAHSIKLGLAHISGAFTSSRIHLPGQLKGGFNPDDSYNTIFPKLDDHFDQALRDGKKTSITFDKNGNHWVTLFIDPKHKKLIYFDSFGSPLQPINVGQAIKLGENKLKQYLEKNRHCSTEALVKSRYQLEAITQENLFGFLMKIKRALHLDDFDNYTLSYNQTRFQFDGSSCGQWNILFSDFAHQHYNPELTQSYDEQLKEHMTKIKATKTTTSMINLAENLMHTNLKNIVKRRHIKLPKLTEKFSLDYTNICFKLLIVFMAIAMMFFFPSYMTALAILSTLLVAQFIASAYSLIPFYKTTPQFVASEAIPAPIQATISKDLTSCQKPACKPLPAEP